MARGMKLAMAAVIAAGLVAGQTDEQSWDNLGQLGAGRRIVVVDRSMKTVEGVFTGYTEDAITLRGDGGDVSVPRASVYRVSLQRDPRRGRKALIGAASGAGAGLAAAAIRGATYHEAGETSVFMMVYTPIGAGIGAATGAVWPAGKVTVYRAAAPAR
jgi:hypothetical protein